MTACDLPEGVKSVEVLRLEPGDVLVLQCELHLSHHAIANLKERMEECFPGVKCAVLDQGMTLAVARNGEADGTKRPPTDHQV